MPDNPDNPIINFNNILRNERKSKLFPLENDFYEKAAAQIQELQDEKNKIEDIYCTKYGMIDDELRTVRKSIENIIERRIGKIIKEASLSASSKQKEKQDIQSMTREEKIFYNRLLEVMTEWRSEVVNNIFKKEKTVHHQPGCEEDKLPEILPLEKNDKTKEPPEKNDDTNKEPPEKNDDSCKEHSDKKDISKEYIVVRLLKDIPTFVGVDERNYTFAKEDVAVLSTINAKALINRKAAIQIMVNR